MLAEAVQRMVAIPWIYDLVQTIAGSKYVRIALQAEIDNIPLGPGTVVIDVGGGTGLNRDLFPAHCTYICLDNDPAKLTGFSDKYSTDSPVLADAGRIPIKSGSVDIVLCTQVSHHVTDELLLSLITESLRILKADGRLVFSDAVWEERRVISRLLWRFDGGKHPRSSVALGDALATYGKVVNSRCLTLLHKYMVTVVSQSNGAG